MRLTTLVVVFGVLTAALAQGQDGGVVKPVRVKQRADAGMALEAPARLERGPTEGCPAECYSSCGGGAMRIDRTPTARELRCSGCRNICQDTGKWPPGVHRDRGVPGPATPVP